MILSLYFNTYMNNSYLLNNNDFCLREQKLTCLVKYQTLEFFFVSLYSWCLIQKDIVLYLTDTI